MGDQVRDASGAKPCNRIFHLHYHVPDISYAEDALAAYGLPLHARFGWVDEEIIALRPEDDTPDDFQFRLQDSQRGYANVTLTSGKKVQFDHLGIISDDFEGITERADTAGWGVQGIDEPRTFLFTPWGFRVEIHPEGNRVEESLGPWEVCRFKEVILTAPDREPVEDGFDTVIGPLPQLSLQSGYEQVEVPKASLTGNSVESPIVLQSSHLSDSTTTNEA